MTALSTFERRKLGEIAALKGGKREGDGLT